MDTDRIWTWQRTFTPEDVRAFADVSGDKGHQHVIADENGRLVVHGLLTATLPTKIGGDMNYLARTMTFDFKKMVYTGDCIQVEAKVDEVLGSHRLGTRVSIVYRCLNGEEIVMDGTTSGIVLEGTHA